MGTKKGFTLVELIGVITILALLMLLLIPSITGVSEDSKVSLRESKIRTLLVAGEEFGNDIINDYQNCLGSSSSLDLSNNCTVSISKLINLGYINSENDRDEMIDPVSNEAFKGNLLLCYNPVEVNVYASYVEDGKYSCKSIALDSDNTLNLSSIGGFGYVGGDDVEVNIIKSGEFSSFNCRIESADSGYASCSIASNGDDEKKLVLQITDDRNVTFDNDFKEISVTVNGLYLDNSGKNQTLTKIYSLKVYPTKLKVVDDGNACVEKNSTLQLDIDKLNEGTISVETSDNSILEGTAKDGKLYISSKNNDGHATLTLKENNGYNESSVSKIVYDLRVGEIPDNIVIHTEALVPLTYLSTGNVKIYAETPNVVEFKSSKVSASDTITLTDEDKFTISANNTGTTKIIIEGDDCGRIEKIVTVSNLSLQSTSGFSYVGGANLSTEIITEEAHGLRCESSDPMAATCSINATTLEIYPGSRANDDVVITVRSDEGGYAYYHAKILKTSIDVQDRSGNRIGTVCTEMGSNRNSDVVYVRGENLGDTYIDDVDIEEWYLADATVPESGIDRTINLSARSIPAGNAHAPYRDGLNTGRTKITVHERNGGAWTSFYYNVYSLNLSNNSANIKIDETVEFEVEASATGDLNISSSDSNVASVTVEDGPYDGSINAINKVKVTVTGNATGDATIIIRGSVCGTKTFNVHVEGKTLSITLKPGTYTTGLGANVLSCKTTGFLRSCSVKFPDIYTTSEFQVVGYSKDKDSTTASYRPGDSITINLLNNGSVYYGNSMDTTKPVCSIAENLSNTIIGETEYVTMNCVDTGSGLAGTGSLSKDNFSVSNTDIGEVVEVSSPTSISNGFSYRVGIKSKNIGLFSISLKANSVKDKFGNGNDSLTLNNIFSSEYDFTSAYYIGKENPQDVVAVLYDNATMGTGSAGTYTLVVYGNGDMRDFFNDSVNVYPPWYDTYHLSITNVIINEGVTNIGGGFMYNCSNLTSLTIPNGVTYVGRYAFSMTDIRSLTIPNSVTSIENRAFYGNENLTDLTIGNGVVTIGDAAFYNNGVSHVTIPAATETIGYAAFGAESGVSKLTALTFQGNSQLKTIGDAAFIYHKLTSVTIPTRVTSIGANAFAQTSGKENTTLVTLNFASTNTLRTIGDYAFSWCPIASLTLPSSLESIGQEAFIGLGEGITTFKIGPNVKTLGDNFVFGKSLEAFEVDASNRYFSASTGVLYNKAKTELVKCPGDYYKRYDTLDVPATVKTLKKGAFYGWLDYGENIRAFTLNLPSGLSNMNIDDNFIFFTVGAINISGNSEFESVNGVLYSKDKKTIYRLPTAFDASEFSIPSSVTNIASYFGYGNSRVHTIEVPLSVTSIGANAFLSDTRYGFKTIDLNTTDSVSFTETSFGITSYDDTTNVNTLSRTINVTSASLKTRLENMYRSAPYTLNVVQK